MREADYDEFAGMLADVWALKTQVLTGSQKAMYFRALSGHSLDAVRSGLDAHVKDPQRGRFLPMPADIIAQIEGLAADDGRPGPEEAWATALLAADESRTVVWTEEAAAAWAIARPLQGSGDQIGARMAFKEAYCRLVDEARKARRPAVWQPSLGFDPQQRESALQAAQLAGLQAAPEQLSLPAPAQAFEAIAAHAPPGVLDKLRALRDQFTQRANHDRAVEMEVKRIEAQKTDIAVTVAEYEARSA